MLSGSEGWFSAAGLAVSPLSERESASVHELRRSRVHTTEDRVLYGRNELNRMGKSDANVELRVPTNGSRSP